MNRVNFYSQRILPALKQRLLKQNPGIDKVSDFAVRVQSPNGGPGFLFRLFSVEKKNKILPGALFRIGAYRDNPALSLFPNLVGYFDYRLYKGSAISHRNHDETGSNDKMALRVLNEYKSYYSGLGHSLAGIGMNHAASKGIKDFYFYDVVAINFIYNLSPTASIMEAIHDDVGAVNPEEYDLDSPEVTVNMRINLERENFIPRISINLRV